MKKLLLAFIFFNFIFTVTYAENLSASVFPEDITTCSDDFLIKHEIYVEGIGNVDIREFSNQSPTLFSTQNLPSSFDATEKGWVTPVKNQKQYGTCWAFSTISAIETNMIKKGYETKDSADYSELHLSYFSHNLNQSFGDGKNTYTSSLGYYCGDNPMHAAQHLIGWQGVAKESDYPYPPPSIDYTLPEEGRYDSVAHLQSYMVIPSNIDTIKKAILEYGSVSVSYYDDDAFYSSNNAYYQNYYTKQNHAVTIVGWDDNYALSNFDGLDNIPNSPGAWKIKNSWGPVWGDDGYFWISYEDPSLAYFTAFDAEDANNYHILHQHDGADVSHYFSGQAAANIFTADENQTLKAVGFYIHENNVEYEIEIYKLNKSYSNPTNGTLVAESFGYESYQGYHTVKLDNSVPLKKGDAFSVVLKLSNNYYPFEGPNASSSVGESYILQSGRWQTDYTYNNTIKANNACIKVYSSRENLTVTFDSTGGTDVQAIEIPSGSLLDIPPCPSQKNAYFAGWYKDSSFNQEWNFESDTVTEDITLYAKWSDTPILIESITLSANKTEILTSDTLEISAKISPYYASNKTLSWIASDESITISNGNITGTKKGSYTVTASTTDGSGISNSYSFNIYEPLKNISVKTQHPVHKTDDTIIYLLTCENAKTIDFYIETPENKHYMVSNAPQAFSLNINYIEGQYTIYAIAYDTLGNSIVSDKKTFWVTDKPMLITRKTDAGYQVGGYNKADSILMIAYYNNNELLSVSTLNALNTLSFFNDNTNATTLKLLWWDSNINMTPISDNITITNPSDIPVGTIVTAQ